ncbi:hypothetical protein [Saccharothrix sp. ST-888]|uniref:hypothetical protein n=1 Tax=Saccharothrix sp. ST-888 TaxID=1427391 RepID=UPI0005ECED5D|nr:hypothetical protein [Saccharothrix sp. ST-888]KJK59487.1 hypothetical protein UK12_03410 [Saccharothrix sp. ST-888]
MGRQLPRADVLLAVMGGPHVNDTVTSAVRLAQALLERGATVQIWTCGHATGLTKQSLGGSKPRNLENWEYDYPSSAMLAKELLDSFPEQLTWYSCRFCTEERGSQPHIEQIRLRPPFKFTEHLDAVDNALFLGVC